MTDNVPILKDESPDAIAADLVHDHSWLCDVYGVYINSMLVAARSLRPSSQLFRCSGCGHEQTVSVSHRDDGSRYFGSNATWCDKCEHGKPEQVQDSTSAMDVGEANSLNPIQQHAGELFEALKLIMEDIDSEYGTDYDYKNARALLSKIDAAIRNNA